MTMKEYTTKGKLNNLEQGKAKPVQSLKTWQGKMMVTQKEWIKLNAMQLKFKEYVEKNGACKTSS